MNKEIKDEFFDNQVQFWVDPKAISSGYSDGTDIDMDKVWFVQGNSEYNGRYVVQIEFESPELLKGNK